MLNRLLDRLYEALEPLRAKTERYLASKSKREKWLLLSASCLIIIFIMLELVYMPLFTKRQMLQTTLNHTKTELEISKDSMQSTKDKHLAQSQMLEASIKNMQQNITKLKALNLDKTPLLNPFALIPALINFAKAQHISIDTFIPYPKLNALAMQGSGEFSDIIALLKYIESNTFYSIENIALYAKNGATIGFSVVILDYREAMWQEDVAEDLGAEAQDNVIEDVQNDAQNDAIDGLMEVGQ